MKKLLFAIALCVAFGSGMMAQKTTTAVDAEGVKVVVMTTPGKIKKEIKKDEFSLIKTLKIDGNMNTDDFMYLQNLTSLVIFDVTDAKFEGLDLYDFISNNIYGIKFPSVRALITKAKATPQFGKTSEERAEQNKETEKAIEMMSGLNKDEMLFRYYLDWVDDDKDKIWKYSKMFPNVEKIITTEVCSPQKLSFDAPEKLYVSGCVNVQPIIMFERGLIIYDKTDIKRVNDCQIIYGVSNFGTSKGNDLDNAIFVSTIAFSEYGIDTLFVPSSVKFIEVVNGVYRTIKTKSLEVEESDDILLIGDNAFEKSELAELTFDRPVFIGRQAFLNSKPGKVTFNKKSWILANAFSKESNPWEVWFNSDVQYLGKDIFGSAITVNFTSVPKKVEDGATRNFRRILIPAGEKDNFSKVGIAANIYESVDGVFDGETYNITVEKPGTILSYLPLDKLNEIDSLTITGFLYETDLKIINRCTFLTYLDISKTFSTLSPELLKKIDDSNKEISAIASLIGAAADMEYQDGNISTMDHEVAKAMAELVKEACDVKMSNPDCCVVYLTGLQYLRTVKLPIRAIKIVKTLNDCPLLENIELPKYIEVIGGRSFSNCPSIKHITFPETVCYIDDEAFVGCTGLTEVDLSHLTFNTRHRNEILMRGCVNLKVLKYPKGLKKLRYLGGGDETEHYFTDVMDEVPFDYKKTFHLKNQTPPIQAGYNHDFYPWGMTLYIPKGCTTSYYTTMGSGNKYIEE